MKYPSVNFGSLTVSFVTEDSEIHQLCYEYWAYDGEKFSTTVKDLAQAHGMNERELLSAIQYQSWATLSDNKCSECRRVFGITNRTKLIEAKRRMSRKERQLCNECENYAKDKAKRQRLKDDEWKSHLLNEYVQNQTPVKFKISEPCDISTFSESQEGTLEDALFETESGIEILCNIIALIDCLGEESVAELRPLDTGTSGLLTPHRQNDVALLRKMTQIGILQPSCNSDPSCVACSKDEPFSWYFTKSRHTLWFEEGDIVHIISRFYHEARNMSREHRDWIVTIAAEIQFAVCRAYLEETMDEYNMPFEVKADGKAETILRLVLQDFSPSQAFSFIWKASANAAAYYQKGGISRKQAANSVISRIHGMAERAKINGWDVSPFHRGRRGPQSSLERVYSNAVFGIDDGLFKLRVNDILAKARPQ